VADELAKLLVQLAQKPTTVTARPQKIDNLHQFICNNVPYGMVDAANLKQGLIEIDGPAAQQEHTRKPDLQWFFGGRPHSVPKAFRIHYTYKQYDMTGNTADINASLFLGFEMQLPFAAPAKAPAQLLQDPIANLTCSVQKQLADHPSSVVVVSQELPSGALDDYLASNAPAAAPPFSIDMVKSDHAGAGIEYDGPAQENDSHAPFTLGLTALFNDREKFDRLLYWYFGGKAYRITKAIRIPYQRNGANESLLIGYQGPPSGG
jgi:hypothetical protein